MNHSPGSSGPGFLLPESVTPANDGACHFLERYLGFLLFYHIMKRMKIMNKNSAADRRIMTCCVVHISGY